MADVVNTSVSVLHLRVLPTFIWNCLYRLRQLILLLNKTCEVEDQKSD